jgi:hypothetical protein
MDRREKNRANNRIPYMPKAHHVSQNGGEMMTRISLGCSIQTPSLLVELTLKI